MPATLADIQAKYGDSVYPLYKDQMHEPYMEADNGVGYKGVVMYDEKEDRVQCSECGEWFGDVACHLTRFHKINPVDYRDDNGLTRRVPLCSKEISVKRSISATKQHKTRNLIPPSREKMLKVQKMGTVARKVQKTEQKIQFKNRYGLCDAQIACRLKVVSQIVGQPVSKLHSKQIERYDQRLYSYLNKNYAGEDIFEKYGLTNDSITKKCTEAMLIADLRRYVLKHKSMPILKRGGTRDDRGDLLRSHPTYVKYFGSWRRAKMMAGLDQLLAEVK